MGACATKPKADATDAPAPLPEKDEVVSKELTVAATVVETKEVVYAADNSRSLSNLLNEVISLINNNDPRLSYFSRISYLLEKELFSSMMKLMLLNVNYNYIGYFFNSF